MIENLIELAKYEVPITMSSLINTVFKKPDNALAYIKNGYFSYAENTTLNYRYCIINLKIGIANYYLLVINYNSKQKRDVVTLEDQVIIIKIKRESIAIYTNHKYTD